MKSKQSLDVTVVVIEWTAFCLTQFDIQKAGNYIVARLQISDSFGSPKLPASKSLPQWHLFFSTG